MYAYIDGKLTVKNPAYVVVDCHGVGYMLHISLYTFEKIKELQQAKLFTQLIVREDAHILFGFYDEVEQKLFRLLIGVSGVGANTARMILSSLPPDDLALAIINENVKLLQTIKGIGNKSAQRLVIELKDKLKKESFSGDNSSQPYNTNREEALSALVMLGFVRLQAEKALDKILASTPELSVENLIKQALKIL